jgi:hypothetical protein
MVGAYNLQADVTGGRWRSTLPCDDERSTRRAGFAANGSHDHANLCGLTGGEIEWGDSIAGPGGDSQNRLEESNQEA